MACSERQAAPATGQARDAKPLPRALPRPAEKQLRKRLEGEFGVQLGDRKALLRAEINAYLEAQVRGISTCCTALLQGIAAAL